MIRKKLIAFLITSLSVAQAQEKLVFLDNGSVRLGVDMSAGGSIAWVSRSDNRKNILNAFDHGRYIQQSFYGDEDGSDWNGKPWRYNPVQGGSWKNVPSTVLESKLGENEIYVKTRPRQWARGDDVKDMVFEQTLSLEGDTAVLKLKMTYTGEKSHKARHQELPAVFVEPEFDTLVFCPEGAEAWKGAPVVKKQPGFPNELFTMAEPWAAWVNSEGYGLGVYFPHTDFITSCRVRNGNAGDCSYLSPLQTFALVPGLVFESETVLAIGNVESLREKFSKIAARTASNPESSDAPDASLKNSSPVIRK